MKVNNLHIAILASLLLSACNMPSDWTPYYESQHKTPYGTKIFQEQLENIFPDAYTDILKDRTDEVLASEAYGLSTYMYVNPKFYPDSLEYAQLEQYAKEDNALFIATEDRNAHCIEKYSIEIERDSAAEFQFTLERLSTVDQHFTLKNRRETANYFSQIPPYATVLGSVTIGDSTYPNFIAIRLANYNNKLYLHAQPDVFSNYHMLQDEDGRYALNTLSYLKYTDYFVWDGYGTKRRYNTPPSEGDTAGLLRYIYGSKPLTFAFITLIALALLFFGFNYKRVTRAIPVLRPERNNSIDFMNLVANLFVNEENQIAIAKYRANYVLDRIKERYYLDPQELDENFRKALATKTQVDERKLVKFVAQLNKIRYSKTLDKAGFIRFSEAIENGISLIKLNQ
jgi:hypothetical protein